MTQRHAPTAQRPALSHGPAARVRPLPGAPVHPESQRRAGRNAASPSAPATLLLSLSARPGRTNPLESTQMTRPPLPPFTRETALQKVRMAEDGWNGTDPEKVALAYTADSQWRNRAEIFEGREAIIAFLTRKWARELDYRLVKELWTFEGNRIAVRFAYEWRDDSGTWFRAFGNENWEFAENGLMRRRIASINDTPIAEAERLLRWEKGPRPEAHPGLTELGL